jgi:Flp pilus assembly protein TadD
MTDSRIESLSRLLDQRPDDPRLRFGLALEHEKLAQWDAVVEHLEIYLEQTDDEGNAWGRLGGALRRLGRDNEARVAYAAGIRAANRHGHPTMAAEFEELLAEWDQNAPPSTTESPG